MVTPSKDRDQVDVASLTRVLESKGFTPSQVVTRLAEYGLEPTPALRTAAVSVSVPRVPKGRTKTAQAAESEIEPAVREAVMRLSHTPSEDEVNWVLAEAAEGVGDPILAALILQAAAEPPAPGTPPRGINPKAMSVWKKMFKEHGDEIKKAKGAKQWATAVAIFKNMAKKEGYEPFLKKTAWTLDEMSAVDLGQALRDLSALAEHMEVLGHDELAADIDGLSASLEERFDDATLKAAMNADKARLASRSHEINPMPFEDFRIILAEILDAGSILDFEQLFKATAVCLRNVSSMDHMKEVRREYDRYVVTFYETQQVFATAPPEILEEEMFGYLLAEVPKALFMVLQSVGNTDYGDASEHVIFPVNMKRLRSFLDGHLLAKAAHQIISRIPLWRQQFGL
jgi:hypothetical protein